MSQSRFLDMLEDSPTPLLSDGAMGTQLNERGVPFDQCFDNINLTQPDLVMEIHRAYIQAGSQIIQTNTFGANRFKLAEHGLEEKVALINRAGVVVARQAAVQSDKEVLIAGDVGPLGVRLAPFGRVQPEQARQAFAEQMQALADAGADLIIIETISDLNEVQEAVAAARQVCDLPIIASMTFTRDDRTLMGDAPAGVALALQSAGVDVIGNNCSGGPAHLWRILRQMRQAAPQARFSVMPNAGWPEQVGGRVMYPANPEYFGEYALAFCEAGAAVIATIAAAAPASLAAIRLRPARASGMRTFPNPSASSLW